MTETSIEEGSETTTLIKCNESYSDFCNLLMSYPLYFALSHLPIPNG